MPPPNGSHLTAQHLNDQTVLRAQAALVGAILTNYGRVRATTALERRLLTLTV